MMKKILFFIIMAVVSFSLFAQAHELSQKALADGRWYNDEYSFDFSKDGSYTAYYTFGEKTGSMKGKIWYKNGNNFFLIPKGTIEDVFDTSFMNANKVKLYYVYDPQNPKSVLSLRNEDGSFILWNKNYFVKKDKEITIKDIPAVTMGYTLSATTENLRIRKGPSTDFQYMTFFYRDGATGRIKSWGSILAGTNIRVLARTTQRKQVGEWNNYWYYIEYKEPLGSLMVYKNAWCFAEFINTRGNANRIVTVSSPQNERAYYGANTIKFRGRVSGKPVKMKVQLKNSDGTVIKVMGVRYSQESGRFTYTATFDDDSMHFGANIFNFIAEYYDGKTSFSQVTVYVHEVAAERAKPVIYLYPEKKTEVSVRVNPKRGISKSDPPYQGGWIVTASPDGTLVNKADGKSYPYLFWEAPEGESGHPHTGFVVKTSELGGFFDEKLALLGLNRREIKDFKEFWLPILTKGKYYYIYFYDTAAINHDAPLQVTPAPETIIRVYFDSKPLDKPVSVKEQKLTRVRRKGFTVVEWGGRRY
ncbi:MAG: hypothetical protein P8107_09400 [Spirochaetia bacterium]